MRKKWIVLAGILLSAFTLGGCGQKISNEVISIEQYKGLKVEKTSDEDDYASALEFKENIWESLLDECTFLELPQEELEQRIEKLKKEYSYVVAGYEDSTQLIKAVHGMTVEEFAEQQLKKEYAIRLIAKEEELELSEEEYQQALTKIAKENGMTSEEYEHLLGYDEQYQIFLEERVLEFLKEHLK